MEQSLNTTDDRPYFYQRLFTLQRAKARTCILSRFEIDAREPAAIASSVQTIVCVSNLPALGNLSQRNG
jgi:hypothetical protein